MSIGIPGTRRAVVVGAGVGGLAASIDLALAGWSVTLCERAAAPGGKMREVAVAGRRMDAGPTVFTMRWVFEDLFAAAGDALEARVALRPAALLARHAWSERERLDLFADIDRSAEAIGHFAGPAEAAGYRAFCERARRIYRTLERPFIRAARPTPLSLATATNPRELLGIAPFTTMWRALGDHFADPRLRQLFGRYATYCGSSPFAAPATLMLVAHVEQDGVWLVEGGMHALALALADLARRQGVALRYGQEVAQIAVGRNGATGVVLASGERLDADAVVVNADVAAVGGGAFGSAARAATAETRAADRSLSALTWTMLAEAGGFPFARHSVFFSRDYKAEFDDLAAGRPPAEPTVYICAQDRDDEGARPDAGGQNGSCPDSGGQDSGGPDCGEPERLLCLVNAPPTGDRHRFDTEEIALCASRMHETLARCGLRLRVQAAVATSPADFETLFPRTGGALYGPASHGWAASFRRAGARTRIPRLYLAGGSVHPGPGVPMSALSGRIAAASLIADLAPARSGSITRSRATATAGGTSTR